MLLYMCHNAFKHKALRLQEKVNLQHPPGHEHKQLQGAPAVAKILGLVLLKCDLGGGH